MRRQRNERLEAYFRKRPELGIAAVWAFGSWAAGRPHWESQISFGVLPDPTAHPDRASRLALRSQLESDLAEIAEDPAIDLVLLTDAPPSVARRIVTEGRRLLAGDPETVRSFLRDVQVRAADMDAFLRLHRRARTPVLARSAR